jgi:hypothetical protein
MQAKRLLMIAGGAAAVVLLFLLLRPGGDDEDESAAATTTAATATAPTTTAETSSPPPAATTEPPPPPPPPPPLPPKPQVTVIPITIRGGKPVGGIERARVKQGRRVRFVVRSDVADHVHVHGYDLMRDVAPGKPARIAFRATIPGQFEVELEDRGLQIAELEVRP